MTSEAALLILILLVLAGPALVIIDHEFRHEK